MASTRKSTCTDCVTDISTRSADGTTVITSLSTNEIQSFVLPQDLLSPQPEPHHLIPQGNLMLPEATHVVAPAPYFTLGTPYTQVVLIGCIDHPIQLHYALPEDPSLSTPSASPLQRQRQPLSTYKCINLQTEAYLTPYSLIWPKPGTHFITGSANLLAYFDISRNGSEPLLRICTIPSRRHLSKGGGVGMRGTVSALAAQPANNSDDHDGCSTHSGLVAAGTWTRWVGLYDFMRAGEAVANWSVANAGSVEESGLYKEGTGIVQTVWSPCGRYLVINERKSTGLLVYDVRVTGKLLGCLIDRNATTNQRLSCDVYPGSADVGGFEVWAGTDDGTVAVWEAVGTQEHAIARSWSWLAHESPVGSTALHPSGSVVATCSGSWYHDDTDDCIRDGTSIKTTKDAHLGIWNVGMAEKPGFDGDE